MLLVKKRDRVDYRKIYVEHYGPIPIDEDGRVFDIDHIDGDPLNHDPENLQALSIRDHYKKHYDAGDFLGARAIAMRMNVSPEERSRLASLAAKQRVENGTNPFGHHWNERLKREGRHPWTGGEQSRKNALKLVEDGRHPFSGGKVQSESNKKRVDEGTHNFLGGHIQRRQLSEGTHNFQQRVKCPHCDYWSNCGNVAQHVRRKHECATPQ